MFKSVEKVFQSEGGVITALIYKKIEKCASQNPDEANLVFTSWIFTYGWGSGMFLLLIKRKKLLILFFITLTSNLNTQNFLTKILFYGSMFRTVSKISAF